MAPPETGGRAAAQSGGEYPALFEFPGMITTMSKPETSRSLKSSLDKGRVKIHNLLPTLERTYLPVGSVIGKYRIIEEIDRGGMAVVYRAMQLDLDREVALKVLPANITINRKFVERFLSEAHAVAKLTHPGIVNIHEVAVQNNVYYLAMDYIPGVNLYYHLNYQKPKLIEVLEITAKLADALSYAHRQKIVHRDLKLNNVIMKDNLTPVLIDFGLAKALEGEEANKTKTGEIMGSPAYMAPERLYGRGGDARSDICSLGIMLYEMLTFKNPYLDPRSIHQTTLNVIEANPIPPRKLVMWLPPEIEAITLKAMHKDPDKRYQTMEEFAEDIRRYQRGEPVLANPPSLWTRIRHYARRRWPFLSIFFLIALFAGIFSYLAYAQSKKERPYWQVMYQKRFIGLSIGDEWSQYPGVSEKNEGWSIKNSELLSPGGPSFIRLDRPITRDARVEFDIRSVGLNFYNVGFFLYGSRPDSGYCFHLFRGPAAECGITYPGGSYLFSDYNPLEFVPAKRFHVVVERKENVISYRVNDMLIGKICDFFPPYGPDHQSMGFFVNGSQCAIENMKIYRYAIPMMPSPTLIADRFAERGAISTAIDEYRELLMDFSEQSLAQDIVLKIAECCIRLGKYDQALEALRSPRLDGGGDAVRCRVLYLSGVMQSMRGNRAQADSAFTALGALAGQGTLFQSALAIMTGEMLEELKVGDPASAARTVASLTRKFPKYSRMLGRFHLAVMNRYAGAGALDSAIETGQAIVTLHADDADILSFAKVKLSELYLVKGRKGQALDLLNQCIASYQPTEGLWAAWMDLASMYECDGNLADAYTTYHKVFEDCPKSLVTAWFARIKMGELASRTTSAESPKGIFEGVARSPHPFVAPRAVAQYYRGVLSNEDLAVLWDELYPGDKGYLFCFVKKSVADRRWDDARAYLEEMEESLPSSSILLLQAVAYRGLVHGHK
jgi:serine/threonine protein kinase/predicted negative regulator of RcsB-dependent stress response